MKDLNTIPARNYAMIKIAVMVTIMIGGLWWSMYHIAIQPFWLSASMVMAIVTFIPVYFVACLAVDMVILIGKSLAWLYQSRHDFGSFSPPEEI
ncbi:MAG: hypothetical protein WC244_03120 [Patescibacteria group bacterium]